MFDALPSTGLSKEMFERSYPSMSLRESKTSLYAVASGTAIAVKYLPTVPVHVTRAIDLLELADAHLRILALLVGV